ncbi:MAG: hypothetical protein ACYCV0_06485 [Desulfitobacteriaceae bacterium]
MIAFATLVAVILKEMKK